MTNPKQADVLVQLVYKADNMMKSQFEAIIYRDLLNQSNKNVAGIPICLLRI
jgi:hypothetical protein